ECADNLVDGRGVHEAQTRAERQLRGARRRADDMRGGIDVLWTHITGWQRKAQGMTDGSLSAQGRRQYFIRPSEPRLDRRTRSVGPRGGKGSDAVRRHVAGRLL